MPLPKEVEKCKCHSSVETALMLPPQEKALTFQGIAMLMQGLSML